MKERFAKYPFHGNAHGLTMFEVTHVYQLTPPPPELYTAIILTPCELRDRFIVRRTNIRRIA